MHKNGDIIIKFEDRPGQDLLNANNINLENFSVKVWDSKMMKKPSTSTSSYPLILENYFTKPETNGEDLDIRK